MKLLVEFELDESWEEYFPNNEERLKNLIKPQLEGVKTKVVENLDLQNVIVSVCPDCKDDSLVTQNNATICKNYWCGYRRVN